MVTDDSNVHGRFAPTVGYGLQLSEGMKLDSATEMQARRAAGEDARQRAEEADAAAREKIDAELNAGP